MRLALLVAASLLTFVGPAAAFSTPDPDVPTPHCVPVLEADGTTGVSCVLLNANCAQVIWGYHSEFLTVGGNNGCHAEVLVNPNAEPSGPWDEVVEQILQAIDTSGLPASCYLPTATSVECWIDTGYTYAVGVRCGTVTNGVGVACTLLGLQCAQVIWGVHTTDLHVGGYNGCQAGVWATP